MLGWWKKRVNRQETAQFAPRKLGSPDLAAQTIMLAERRKPQEGAVKMDGAYRSAQEALQRGARGFLYVYEGPASGRTFFLERAPASIGRSAEQCDLALNDPLVSRIQCRIQPNLSTFRLIDSGSKNGTRLNDQPVAEQDLVNGDQIAVGSSRIYVGIL
jgi:pSer/pThr/pTyr-binding forkhead associated (FHA) protein